MSTFDTVVRGGRIVRPSGAIRADSAVADGRGAATEPEVEGPAAVEMAGDLLGPLAGIAGGQSTLQSMLTAGHGERGCRSRKVTSVCSANAARRFGLSGKGRIGVGMDADLVLIDLDVEHVLEAGDLFQGHKQSPYLGRTLRGRISGVLVRRETVFDGAKPAPEPTGRLVRPAD